MRVTRRKLLKAAVGAAGACLVYPHLWLPALSAAGRKSRDNVLLVVQLAGGNDGFNTVIPYGSPMYYRARPTLALCPDEVLPFDGQIGLHKSMGALAALYRGGTVAIINGVGYPDQSRSHMRSTLIWHTAEPNRIVSSSWMDRYMQLCKPGLLKSQRSATAGVEAASGGVNLSQACASHDFKGKLKAAAQTIATSSGARIYNISLPGFDTHAGQKDRHACLLKELSDGLSVFQSALREQDMERNVIVMVFSEFGRRLAENNDAGTDHGTAGPVFIIGSSVKGGLYGEYPSLSNQYEGDCRYTIDFRTIYATIVDRWLLSDSREILGGRFNCLGFL